ncbi:MAG: class II glutamine amidotransferase, partial [Candidatus Eremiobacterota bacterium]
MDRPREECGVLGLYSPDGDVARMAFFGLFALQHRGQEAAGIAVSDGTSVRIHKGLGLVSHVFDEQSLAPLTGDFAIGHTRYSTTGSHSLRNAQPFLIETLHGPVAVAHNGNLVNAASLRQELLSNGVGLSSSSDTEVITMMLAGAEGSTWEERIRSCMPRWKGAYCLTILCREGVYCVRD